VLFGVVAMLAVPFAAARAQLAAEPVPTRGPDARMTIDNLAVTKDQGKSATTALTTVYDNTSATPQFSVSSTDLNSVWGDELFTTGTGVLSTHKFTLYNSSSSAGPLLTASVSVSFFDAVTSAFLGGYSGNINFGAGLLVNQFAVITASPLDAFLINLNVSDVIVTQTVTAKTGAASRLGIVTFGPILVGGSPGTMYISSATIGGGVPGFYNLGSPADPGYYIAVNPPPVGTVSKTWSSLKKLYH